MGVDQACQPPSKGKYSSAWLRSGRALHSGRPVVHCRQGAGGKQADPHCARGQ